MSGLFEWLVSKPKADQSVFQKKDETNAKNKQK